MGDDYLKEWRPKEGTVEPALRGTLNAWRKSAEAKLDATQK